MGPQIPRALVRDIRPPLMFGGPPPSTGRAAPKYEDFINSSWGNLIFSIGVPGSGFLFHEHFPAWNAVLFGRKRWFLFPGARSPPERGRSSGRPEGAINTASTTQKERREDHPSDSELHRFAKNDSQTAAPINKPSDLDREYIYDVFLGGPYQKILSNWDGKMLDDAATELHMTPGRTTVDFLRHIYPTKRFQWAWREKGYECVQEVGVSWLVEVCKGLRVRAGGSFLCEYTSRRERTSF